MEITEVVLVHGNIFNIHYQQDSKILYTLVPNKPFGSLLEISPKNPIFLKTLNSKFQAIELWLTDQKYQPLEMEEKKLTPVIKQYSYYKNEIFNWS